ncbi:RagB/SusD family nutrient uptake outer membrane protein, partial [Campylobacter fetus subsp. venerealis]
ECLARRGEIQKALDDLNVLLESRWRKGEYEPFSLVEKDDVLDKILEERKKELVFRGQRWTDLKRFAKEGRSSEKLIRILAGQQYVFDPLEENFVFPVPQEEIRNR